MISEAQLASAFAILESVAAEGKRCPQNHPDGPIKTATYSTLARAGRIRVEIYAHNWRVVTIMEGPHKGKSTARSPHRGSSKPYKVIDKDDAPWPSQRQQPWSPVRKT
jgi:hypothetical protein